MTSEHPAVRVWSTIGEVTEYIQRQVPLQIRRAPDDVDLARDTMKVITMKVSKGLGFPVVALRGMGRRVWEPYERESLHLR